MFRYKGNSLGVKNPELPLNHSGFRRNAVYLHCHSEPSRYTQDKLREESRRRGKGENQILGSSPRMTLMTYCHSGESRKPELPPRHSRGTGNSEPTPLHYRKSGNPTSPHRHSGESRNPVLVRSRVAGFSDQVREQYY